MFHRPPDLISHPHENKSILVGMRIRVSWLQARFRGPLAADATSNVVQQHAHITTKTLHVQIGDFNFLSNLILLGFSS